MQPSNQTAEQFGSPPFEDYPQELIDQMCDEWLSLHPEEAPKPANDTATRIQWITATELAAPLPDTKWIVAPLQLCAGRPAIWAGYGAAGKTISMQSLLLSVATGSQVWGAWSLTKRLVCRHFDYEQGKQATTRRYQRLAAGMGADLAVAGSNLAVAVFPDVHLNSRDAVDVYSRECEGVDLVLIDALRGATPGEDENDSKIRACVDNLAKISDRTRTAFVVIHHSNKNSGEGAARNRVRGSSAIFDAAGGVFLVDGQKQEPKKVAQWKQPAEAEGAGIDDFELVIQDVPMAGNPTGGVRIVRHDPKTEDADAQDRKRSTIVDRILQTIGNNPEATKTDILSGAGVKAETAREVFDDLQSKGHIKNEGTDRRPKFVIVNDPRW